MENEVTIQQSTGYLLKDGTRSALGLNGYGLRVEILCKLYTIFLN